MRPSRRDRDRTEIVPPWRSPELAAVLADEVFRSLDIRAGQLSAMLLRASRTNGPYPVRQDRVRQAGDFLPSAQGEIDRPGMAMAVADLPTDDIGNGPRAD